MMNEITKSHDIGIGDDHPSNRIVNNTISYKVWSKTITSKSAKLNNDCTGPAMPKLYL